MKLLPFFLFAVFTVFGQSKPIDVKVVIDNIEDVVGTIDIGVYNKQEGFLDEGTEVTSASKKVTQKDFSFTIQLPAEGEYAFALYQDENSDGKMNKNFLGIPKEPFGFTNIKRMVMSKPKFKKCKVFFKDKDEVRITLL